MKNPKWKQDNPADEMVAMVAAIDGSASNIFDGTTNPRLGARRIMDYCAELRELIKLLPPTQW